MNFLTCITLIFCPLGCLAQGWLQLSDLPAQERDDGVAIAVNNKLYFGTGLREGVGLGEDFYALDLTTNVWKKTEPLPPGAQRQYAAAFRTPDGFCVIGGDGVSGPLSSMFRYSVLIDKWTEMAPRPGPGILGMCCMEFGDRIILAGGRLPDGSLSHEVWEYCISENLWTRKKDTPFGGRWRACATVWNGKGYLFCGMDDDDVFRNELYIYDHRRDQWSEASAFPGPGRTHATVQTVGNFFLMFGGIDSFHNYSNELWSFSPQSGSWKRESDLPGPGRKGGMSVVSDGVFYYGCGITAGDERLNEIWSFRLKDVSGLENADEGILLFPMPVQEELTVLSETPIEITGVYDASGKPITTDIPVKEGTNVLMDFRQTPSGLYFLKIRCGEKELVKKLLRN